MSKKEMIKTNLRGLKLVYSSLSIPKIFVILFIVFDVMYNYWGLFFASHLIDDLVDLICFSGQLHHLLSVY